MEVPQINAVVYSAPMSTPLEEVAVKKVIILERALIQIMLKLFRATKKARKLEYTQIHIDWESLEGVSVSTYNLNYQATIDAWKMHLVTQLSQ